MLGDISPQTVRITQQAVVYPGRDHVVELRVERFDGRKYAPVDMTAVTRVILGFPEVDPVIVYDSQVQAVFTHVGNTLTVDLSDYAMPASALSCQIVLFDAQHTSGQVLVDNIDTEVQFDFRNVSTTGGTPPPSIEYLTDAPRDGVTYARKDGVWVPVDALVSGVSSVNSQTGVVVLNAASVGADPAGAATAAVSAHESDTTPHAFMQNMSKAGFNLTAAQTAGVGEMVWNATDATMDLGLPGGVTLQAGQEFLLRGLNNSGATMVNNTVVYINGAQGNRTVFAKAQANAISADKTIGVLTQDITNNQEGFATLAGLVRGIDTSAWAEGSELWLSAATAGLLTDTKPAAPSNAVSLGYVVRSHATQGSIYVRVAVHGSLRELHDVVVTTPTDGQVLVYHAATQTWVNQAGGGGGGAVASVNGQTGVVVLDAADVGADPTGAASAAVAAHVAAANPHPEYLTPAEGDSVYAPSAHVGAGGSAHSNAVAAGAAGFMSGADKTKLDGIAPAATVNSTDAQLRDRATHTGTQPSTTISDFVEASQDVIGAAITAGANVTVSYNDTTGLTTINATGGGTSLPAVQTFTGAKTLGLSDINTYNVSQDATAQAVTLPAQATVSWTADAEIHIERGAAGAVTVVGAGGVQINGSVAGTFTLGAQYSVVTLKRKAENLWTLFGNAS